MGICLSNTNTIVQAEIAEEEPRELAAQVVEETESFAETELSAGTESFAAEDDGKQKKRGKKKKMVRFKLQDDDGGGRGSSHDRGDSGSGVVRIRVVVTLEELKQILDGKDSFKQASVEQLVNAMKLRGRRVSAEIRTSDGGEDNSWRPALESIPEDP